MCETHKGPRTPGSVLEDEPVPSPPYTELARLDADYESKALVLWLSTLLLDLMGGK